LKDRTGEKISHYRIIDEIGHGGMGVVYRAEDTKLRRTVALKFLPASLSREPEARDRFIGEAQAASALQHNNICTIHDIDWTDDGLMFIVMDLYQGETLKEIIERGPIALDEAVEIVRQIGQGLAQAHEHGILHRDVKPANILVTNDGTVKILDFGLAKLGAGELLTKAGTTLGTVAYMSPEQSRGEDVDQRTDIWSLGVIFYQMLTARLPFNADHDQAVIYLIQNSEPFPAPGMPPECLDVVKKALQKDPQARYQEMRDLLADLQRIRAASAIAKPEQKSRSHRNLAKRRLVLFGVLAAGMTLLIVGFFLLRPGAGGADASPGTSQTLRRVAVLPFTNLRSDPQTDFLGFALADQIIGHLTYVKTLIVRPASAVRDYQTGTIGLATAGEDLNVDLILTGNYLKESDKIRLSVELVDITTNALIWREAMQEEYDGAFKLMDTVAQRVVEGLRVQFSPEELQQMQVDVPRNPLAYEYYLRGISYPVTLNGNRQAEQMFRQSIALDSSFAPAYYELGFRLSQLESYTTRAETLYVAAESAFLKAISLNGGMLSAYGHLASNYAESGQTERAYETAQKILSLNPNSPDGHFFLGYILRYAGLQNRAELEMEKALSLDPNNPRFRSIGITYVSLGKYQKALGGFELDSASTFSLAWKANVYSLMGQPERATPYVNRVLDLEPESQLGLFCQFLKHFLDKRYDLAVPVLKKWEETEVLDGESWFTRAQAFGRIGDAEGATRTLRRAIDGGFFNYPLMLRDPQFNRVRGNADFQRVVAMAKTKYDAFRNRFPELKEERK